MKKKILALTLVFALALALGIGGTVAWLTAQTAPVVNTFTVGDINITLTETTGTDYKFVPGDIKAKDPKVTVKAQSEACYLFVKVEEINNEVDGLTGRVINWAVRESESGWKKLTGVEGVNNVWYREVDAVTADTDFFVLTGSTENANGQYTVNENVTKEMVSGLTSDKPELKFTAYAVQKDNIADAVTAWSKIPAAHANP